MHRFSDLAFTETVRHRQELDGSRRHYEQLAEIHPAPEALGSHELAFLTAADSLYLATVNEDGWPYLQHRGGPAGFVTVLGPARIGWLERSGNRQHVTAGNLDADGRVSIFVMDYPNRARLKLLGRATRIDEPDAELVERLGGGRHTGALVIDVEAWDWNCPKYITPRFTAEAVRSIVEPLQARIAELEQQLGATG